MPIYAYRCTSCGFAKDVLQKMSDAPLTTCPSCGQEAFSKQVTAAGFQLKGSGWYVTDFREKSAASSSNSKEPAASSSTSGAEKPASTTKEQATSSSSNVASSPSTTTPSASTSSAS